MQHRAHDRNDAQERLISAAADLLGEIGPRAMSVRLIADRAGVNHGLVHHYFGSKEGLLRAAMERLVVEHAKWAKELAGTRQAPVPMALVGDQRYLRAVVRSLLDGETELAEMELTKDVSVPRNAMQNIVERAGLDEADAQIKAMVAITMAMEMGWAALEPFIFAVTQTTDDEADEVRRVARKLRAQLVNSVIERV